MEWMAEQGTSVFMRSLIYFGCFVVAAATALPALAENPVNMRQSLTMSPRLPKSFAHRSVSSLAR